MIKFCPECWEKNDDSAKFCQECGHPLTENVKTSKVKEIESNLRTYALVTTSLWLVVALISYYRNPLDSYPIIWIIFLLFLFLSMAFEYTGYINKKIYQLCGVTFLVIAWIIYISYPNGQDLINFGFSCFITVGFVYLMYHQFKKKGNN